MSCEHSVNRRKLVVCGVSTVLRARQCFGRPRHVHIMRRLSLKLRQVLSLTHTKLLQLCLCRFRQSRSAAKKAPVTSLQGTRESVTVSYGEGKVALHARNNTALEELTAVVSMFLLFGCDATRSMLCFLPWCIRLCRLQPLLLQRLAFAWLVDCQHTL